MRTDEKLMGEIGAAGLFCFLKACGIINYVYVFFFSPLPFSFPFLPSVQRNGPGMRRHRRRIGLQPRDLFSMRQNISPACRSGFTAGSKAIGDLTPKLIGHLRIPADPVELGQGGETRWLQSCADLPQHILSH